MEKAKLGIAFIFLAVFCVSVAWAEYDLVMRSGITFSVASAFTLFVVDALFRAPKAMKTTLDFILAPLAGAALL